MERAPAAVEAVVRIRAATADDAPSIAAIYAAQVLGACASYEFTPPDAPEMARRLADVTARGLPWLVAELEGRVAGYAYASPFRQRPGYAYAVEDSVYLADWAAGRGIGRRLLQAVIDDCTAQGYRRMLAVIGDGDNAASIALHRSLGFTMVGTVPGLGFKKGRWLDWVLMQRPLGAGAETLPDDPPGR